MKHITENLPLIMTLVFLVGGPTVVLAIIRQGLWDSSAKNSDKLPALIKTQIDLDFEARKKANQELLEAQKKAEEIEKKERAAAIKKLLDDMQETIDKLQGDVHTMQRNDFNDVKELKKDVSTLRETYGLLAKDIEYMSRKVFES